jgi:hypothetical protein
MKEEVDLIEGLEVDRPGDVIKIFGEAPSITTRRISPSMRQC